MLVKVNISLKSGVFDPQSDVIEKSLNALGCPAGEARQVKTIEFNLPDQYDEEQAKSIASEMAEKLLVNSVMEDFEVLAVVKS